MVFIASSQPRFPGRNLCRPVASVYSYLFTLAPISLPSRKHPWYSSVHWKESKLQNEADLSLNPFSHISQLCNLQKTLLSLSFSFRNWWELNRVAYAEQPTQALEYNALVTNTGHYFLLPLLLSAPLQTYWFFKFQLPF